MPDHDAEMVEVYLQPGQMFLAREPTMIRTILGSCVSASFWSARMGLGALCHAVLPLCPEGSEQGVSPLLGYRYVDFSICDIARKFDRLGAHRPEVQVKLFGGADVLLVGSEASARATVGSINCETALDVLRTEGFHVSASSLRGMSGLNIHFNTGSGEIWLRRLKHNSGFAPPLSSKEGLDL
jgi:chemotaxis protein CheD